MLPERASVTAAGRKRPRHDRRRHCSARSEYRPPPAPRTPPIALEPAIDPGAARIDAFFARFKSATLPAAELTDAFVSALLGDHDREADAYRRALARDPGNPKALAFLAAEPATRPR